MKRLVAIFITCATVSLISFGCQRSAGQTWEDVKTAGRYINRGIDTLCGKHYDTALFEEGEFIGPTDEEFIPLSDKDLAAKYKVSDAAIAQPKFSPGEKGIPQLNYFKNPTAQLFSVFRNLNFETDDHVLRSKEDVFAIQKIAAFLKKNKNMYICVEGHCDERASAAYNMALGTRRANHIRVILIKNGVDYNKIYTVSYGKEKPIAAGHNAEDWKLNRRVQFKLFEKTR